MEPDARHLAAISPHKMLTSFLPGLTGKEMLRLLNHGKMTESTA